MRIIAGTAGSRAIVAPKGIDARPTLDRVRESLFSILHQRVAGARVLDLFAGSGALGLEALSRGAAQCVFVDNARAAQRAVERNIHSLEFDAVSTLLRCDWRAALDRLAREDAWFDLVFLDPPYRFADASVMLAALAEKRLTSEQALIVYEHDKNLPPEWGQWHVTDWRQYGDTVITLLSSRV